MRFLLFAVCVGSLLTLTGCTGAPRHTLGKPATGVASAPVGTLLTASSLPSGPVLLRGTLVEKCPSSGCWFRLKDDSGTIKVDLRGTGATAAEIAPGTEMTVTGVAMRVGDEPVLEASGATY